jgi:hypothetical protein
MRLGSQWGFIPMAMQSFVNVNAESMLRHRRIVNATEWVSILEAILASGNLYDLWWCLTEQTVRNPRQ